MHVEQDWESYVGQQQQLRRRAAAPLSLCHPAPLALEMYAYGADSVRWLCQAAPHPGYVTENKDFDEVNTGQGSGAIRVQTRPDRLNTLSRVFPSRPNVAVF
jgi:hypothetical protein